MNKMSSNLPEIRASETDPPQAGTRPLTASVIPVRSEKSGNGRRKTIRSTFAGFFKWKKTKLWFRGKKEVVVEEIK